MATSRTGTTKYLRNRARVLRDAQQGGLTHCPGFTVGDVAHPCGTLLDYDTPQLPNSAETDHIIRPRESGGDVDDSPDNLRVICRTCNTTRERKHPVPTPAASDFPTSRNWLD